MIDPLVRETVDATVRCLHAENAKLHEQLAAARKDAERLRAVFHRHRKNCHFYGICQPSFKEWIADIDAAMREKAA